MPSCALSRRDPPVGKNGFSTSKGFTIIEFMIALAVLAIITSLALPSYRALLEKRQVTSSAEQAMAFLSSAQLHSVKRNQFVAVNMNADADGWCLGMIAGDGPNVTCNCLAPAGDADACEIEGVLRVFTSDSVSYPDLFLPGSSSMGGDDGTLVFDPVRGLIVGAEAAELQYLSVDSTYALNIEMNPTGRVKMCSDIARASKAVPGYEECPQ